MDKDNRQEIIFLVTVAFLFWIFLVPAVRQARLETRDTLRQEHLTTLRAAIEKFGNDNVFYPTPAPNFLLCTTTHDKKSWFFGKQSPLLSARYLEAIPHDVRESSRRTYTYCATDIRDDGAHGYYLESILEGDVIKEEPGFDFKLVPDDKRVIYRVCGGTATECD
ncbi:MAG: hypothetical protein HYR90_03130 [Candidatus Andersenbacteria bacterium]|nr:hypothetical protein [Candidatus Andersenbacteria bacterium]MBI3250256.1 hypothetical protein [Candidatus Andersenbacteria bacterium]